MTNLILMFGLPNTAGRDFFQQFQNARRYLNGRSSYIARNKGFRGRVTAALRSTIGRIHIMKKIAFAFAAVAAFALAVPAMSGAAQAEVTKKVIIKKHHHPHARVVIKRHEPRHVVVVKKHRHHANRVVIKEHAHD
jgi:hypothetical protein